jgi:hypothetical protein
MKRAISPVFFVLAAACFFLPFFSVSCQGAEQLGQIPGAEAQADFPEVTGFEVVTGAASDELNDPEGATQAGIPPEQVPNIDTGTTQIFAIAAAVLAVVGILVALARGRSGGLLTIGAGVLGAVVLFLSSIMFGSAVSSFNDDLRSFIQSQGAEELGELGPLAGLINIQADNEIGFWLSLLAFLLAAAGGLFLLLTEGRPAAAPARGTDTGTGFGAPSTPPPAAPPPATPPPAAPPPSTPPAGPPPSEPPPPTRP